MLKLLLRIVAYWFMKHLGFPRLLPMNYTVSLLYTCNSRCSTCNVWKKKARDFSVEEYVKTFKSIGRSPYWITFSGGEPFLRQDLVQIVTMIYKISRPRIINIPTNGILTQGIAEKVEAIAKAVSYTHLRAHETVLDLVCRLLLEKKKQEPQALHK